MRCCCTAIEERFTTRTASRDLARYRDKGPRKSTRLLLDALIKEGAAGKSLLDIGGGVGIIAHELIPAGVTAVTSVEASRAYLAAAREEAERQGYADRLTAHYGDFVALAGSIPGADIVTLDRVICCYPDMASLIAASAAHAQTLYGIVIPRDTWWVRLAIGLQSLPYQMHRASFRIYAHRVRAIEEGIHRAGLLLRARHSTLTWDIRIYGATS
jgi:magnesium-protoporphyrin O-methyltransferase